MKNLNILIVALFIILGSCQQNINDPDKPRNVILMIGDGMGTTQVTAGLIANGNLNLLRFTETGFVKTNSADNLITDSAAGGTALATGEKTYNGAIGVDTAGTILPNIVELVEENGFSTGIIATSSITHATPASFYAHQKSRKLDEAIAQDLVNSEVDLFMGGGSKFFSNRYDNQNLISELNEKGFHLIDQLDQNVEGKEKIGYFIAEEQPLSYTAGRGNFLPEATEKAVDFLSLKNNGFFLVVEGSQIDWGGHRNDMRYIITEMLDFDRAVGKALDFAEKDGNTLVIVTSDHETGGMSITGGNINQKLVEAEFNTGGHSAVMVPLFAYGPGAENFGGIIDNTEIYKKIREALQL